MIGTIGIATVDEILPLGCATITFGLLVSFGRKPKANVIATQNALVVHEPHFAT